MKETQKGEDGRGMHVQSRECAFSSLQNGATAPLFEAITAPENISRVGLKTKVG